MAREFFMTTKRCGFSRWEAEDIKLAELLWGYAVEAARAVIDDAFSVLNADGLFAGHNPKNTASAKVLGKLGFEYIGGEFYEPTGLYHPSYELKKR